MTFNKGLYFRVSGATFEKSAIVKAVGKAKAGVLSRQGALVRTIMKRSMKKKKGHAPPGQPPYSHQGNLRKVEFAFDPKTQTVVVGPAKLGDGKAPEIQDKGGMVKVRGVVNRQGVFFPLYLMPMKGRLAAIRSGKIVTRDAKVEARPFSLPALKAAKPMLAKPWKGKIKK